MAINPAIIQQIGVRNNAPALNMFQNTLSQVQNRNIQQQQADQSAVLQPFRQQLLEQQVAQGQQQQTQGRQQQILKSVNDFALGNRSLIQDAQSTGDFTGLRNAMLQRREQLIQQGLPTETTDEGIALIDAGQGGQVISALGDSVNLFNQQQGRGETAKQREFGTLTSGLSKEQKAEATLIELGLSPRAVGSAVQTINDKNIAEQIGNVKATIRQREKFGELTASSRAKTIDSGFEKIVKIDAGLRNIDRAVAELNAGAGVGAIEKFLPSFRASSVALDNIQKSMALDVIGSVTFGALSQGELDLAKEVALPTGLDTPQLIKHLTDRKTAQEKLRGYYQEQIQFLDQGGTVAGFMRSKERGISNQPEQLAAPETQSVAEGQTATGPNGEKAIFTNGQWVVQ
ncbi:MAG TPA: hypothetical protein EYN54_06275 [Methylococcaceae bacterium]|nr:hypothetical protein [Methylococcaceae bacterium]